MRDISKFLYEVSSWANRAPREQVATLAHVMLYCLQKNAQYLKEDANGQAHQLSEELEENLSTYAGFDEQHREAKKANQLINDFRFEDVNESYATFYANRQEHSNVTDSVLWWLLEGEFDNKWLSLSRQLCRKHQVDALYLFSADAAAQVHDLGFGTEINADSLLPPLTGREADLERHLGFLSLAVRQRRHFLLEGQQGVGKSEFVRALLVLASQKWRNASDPVLKNARFIYFRQDDFMGSEEHNRMRLEKLYSYLSHHPNLIPVFDSFEAILNPHLGIQEVFTELFGAILAGGSRTFVLVGRTGGEIQSSLLRQIKSVSLPPLSPTVTKGIAEARLNQLVAESQLRLTLQDPEEFHNQLINLASERYPGRFFPEVALHLAESVLNRAENRIAYLQKAPTDKIILQDLWEHVAEEQSLHVELIGKDPDEFYGSVQERLKQNLIAQDHAVDRICEVLNLMAKQPPRRAPRGRFLFAGPPGVGKTHLGRQLAIQLGLGEEAFFVFNMSEYSSEGSRTRFMGSDPGYVGYKSTKTIYDMVRSRPSCVILLDEIDRADASIQDILLSILEGEGKDAEGNIVYFSQVIFIMTTNQGQDQVSEAYRTLKSKGAERSELAAQFSDEALRSLILKGVVDKTEAGMKEHLRRETGVVKAAFDQWQANPNGQGDGDMLIEHYIGLRQKSARLEQVQRKTPLDRAMLDRVDFVIPFFPIKEPEYLHKILHLSLDKYSWQDCPEVTRRTIIDQALAEDQSVRSIERLVIKHRVDAGQA